MSRPSVAASPTVADNEVKHDGAGVSMGAPIGSPVPAACGSPDHRKWVRSTVRSTTSVFEYFRGTSTSVRAWVVPSSTSVITSSRKALMTLLETRWNHGCISVTLAWASVLESINSSLHSPIACMRSHADEYRPDGARDRHFRTVARVASLTWVSGATVCI